MARKDGAGNVSYYFAGWRSAQLCGTRGWTRTITNATGVACNEADYYLFGGEQTHGNTCDQNYHFAGMLYRDGETANDYTKFRMYESNLGRWMTPDLLGRACQVGRPRPLLPASHPSLFLQRELHAAQEVLEARIGAQGLWVTRCPAHTESTC